jgi:hypothetical protein
MEERLRALFEFKIEKVQQELRGEIEKQRVEMEKQRVEIVCIFRNVLIII